MSRQSEGSSPSQKREHGLRASSNGAEPGGKAKLPGFCNYAARSYEGTFWKRHTIQSGDNLFGISNYYYLMDDFMIDKVALFNEKCASVFSDSDNIGPKHDSCSDMGNMLHTNGIIALPIPVRACNPGWVLKPGELDAHMGQACEKMIPSSKIVEEHCTYPNQPKPRDGDLTSNLTSVRCITGPKCFMGCAKWYEWVGAKDLI